jgi:uncharacterized Zn finger protein (UPF0148 family)
MAKDEESKKRLCEYPGCGTVLSQYNKDKFCSVCQKKAFDEFRVTAKEADLRKKDSARWRTSSFS